MSWQTWTKISGLILFIIAIAGFYLSNIHNVGVILNIENFPQQLDALDISKDIPFTFYIYNEGDKTAFVQSIYISMKTTESIAITEKAIEITPQKDFTIEPGESKEITVLLPAPNEKRTYTLVAEVFYDGKKLSSNAIPVAWGTLL